jgi:GAF domain-containing protein
MEYPLDPNEEMRLAALEKLQVAKLSADPAIDRVTAYGRERFQVPICLATLIEAQRQVLVSRQGIDVAETPRSLSFCTYAILKPQVLVVPDATADERFRDNPLVTGEPFIRFYAGAPLVYKEEIRLGALCLVDYTPREFSPAEQAELVTLAECVVSIILARAWSLPEPDLSATLAQ